MPSLENEEDRSIVASLERWQQTANDEVDDIGGWRNSPWRKQFPQKLHGGNGEPNHFVIHTSCIVSWIARKFPKLDPAPIQQVYAAVNAWYTDWNADRIQPQNELESTLSQAIILLTCVWHEIQSRAIRKPLAEESPKVEAAVETPPEQLSSDDSSNGNGQRKRTGRGQAPIKITNALIKHHGFNGESCSNTEPIGVNELAAKAFVAPSSVTRYFDKRNGGRDDKDGHARYCAVCGKGALELIGTLNRMFA